MKKLLIVVPTMPYPLNAGGKIAQFDFLERLRGHFEITMVFPLDNSEMSSFIELSKKFDNINFIPFINRGLKDKLLSLAYKLPEILFQKMGKVFMRLKAKNELDSILANNSMLFRSKGFVLPIKFIEHFKNILAGNSYDYVQIEFHQLISFVKYVPKEVKKIYIYHELRYVREKREVALYSYNSSILRRLYESNRTFEIKALKEYDLICTLSELDRVELQNTLHKYKSLIYNSPVPIKVNKDHRTFKFNNNLIFLGGEYHFPNKDGLIWFLSTCWNDIKEKHPSLNLLIVGKWEEQTVNAITYKYNGIQFKGFVENLESEMRDSILIVPIRIGSGIRIKILEAINSGVPVISTTVGVEGLVFQHNVDCLIGDEPNEFISIVSELISNDSLSQRLLANAKKAMLENYDYEMLINKRLKMYSMLD